MKTLPDGRIFPEHNGETLSWCLSSTPRDEQEGSPRLRAVIRAMKEHRPEQLKRERHEMLRGSSDRVFGNNARRVLAVIDEELAERKSCFILRAVDVCGTVTFYTGKAGVEYVTGSERDAFAYETLAGAQRKAGVLNRMNAGWRFMPVGFVPNHGIVPASAMETFGHSEVTR